MSILFFVVLVAVIGTLAYHEDKKTRQRYPDRVYVDHNQPEKVDWFVQQRREYIQRTRRQLRREQRHTQQQINQLVQALARENISINK